MPRYLVEINTKKWIVPKVTICYKDVTANDAYSALHKAFADFENDVKYKPSTCKQLEDKKLTMKDLCAGDYTEL